MRSKKLVRGAIGLGLASLVAVAQAALINVDFGRVAASEPYSGAAVLGGAGDVWNEVLGGASGSGLALVGSDNAATGVKLSFSASSAFRAPCTSLAPNVSSNYCGTAYESLLRDYIFVNSGGTGTVVLAGLVANQLYDLVVYSASNATRSTTFTANGVAKTVAYDDADDAMTEGVSYAKMLVDAGAAGQITIQYRGSTGIFPNDEGNFNGLQIREYVAPTTTPTNSTPEPSSLALSGAALLLAARARRRARA